MTKRIGYGMIEPAREQAEPEHEAQEKDEDQRVLHGRKGRRKQGEVRRKNF